MGYMKNHNDKYYICEEEIWVHREDGILGIDDDVDTSDYDVNDLRKVKISLLIPKALFSPINIDIKIPEDLIPQKPISGKPQAIEVPVVLNNMNGKAVVEESFSNTPGWGSNVLGFIRRALKGEWIIDDTKEGNKPIIISRDIFNSNSNNTETQGIGRGDTVDLDDIFNPPKE
jgi:hypothetical protein